MGSKKKKKPWDQIFFETETLPGMGPAERECKNCGILPEYGNFSAVTDGKGRYKHPNHCIPCVRVQRSDKDHNYNTSEKRTLTTALIILLAFIQKLIGIEKILESTWKVNLNHG